MLLIFAFCTILMTDLSPHCLQIRRFTTPSLVVKVQFFFSINFIGQLSLTFLKTSRDVFLVQFFSKSLSITLNLANKLILLTYIQKNLAGGKKIVKFNHVCIFLRSFLSPRTNIFCKKKPHEFSISRNVLLSLTQLTHSLYYNSTKLQNSKK